jgi:hypothetical protein
MLVTPMTRTITALVTSALAAALLGGCAGAQKGTSVPTEPASTGPSANGATTGPSAPAGPSSPSGRPGSPGLSSTQLPAPRPPKGPPKTPSDLITGTWIVGTVTAGGSGPCYRLVTDGGEEYAMHSDAGIALRQGSRIRARVAPLRLRIDCGPGRPVSLLTAEPVR